MSDKPETSVAEGGQRKKDTNQSGTSAPATSVLSVVSIDDEGGKVEVGKSLQYRAKGKTSAQNSREDEDVTDQVVWESTNPKVAKFSDTQKGMLEGVSVGTVEIKAYPENSKTKGSSAQLTVNPSLQSIKLTVQPDQPTFTFGDTVTFTINGTYLENTDPKTVNVKPISINDNEVEWDIYPKDGLSKIETDGKSTCNKFDTIKVKATLKSGGESDSLELTVNPPPSHLEITPTEPLKLYQSQDYKLKRVYDDPKKKDDEINNGVTWTSLDSSVVEIESSGRATGKKLGEAFITAKINKTNAQCALQVKVVPALLILQIQPEEPILSIGQEVSLRAVGIYSDESSSDVTELATWKCNAPSTQFELSDAFGSKGRIKALLPEQDKPIKITVLYQGIAVSTTIKDIVDIPEDFVLFWQLLGEQTKDDPQKASILTWTKDLLKGEQPKFESGEDKLSQNIEALNQAWNRVSFYCTNVLSFDKEGFSISFNKIRQVEEALRVLRTRLESHTQVELKSMY